DAGDVGARAGNSAGEVAFADFETFGEGDGAVGADFVEERHFTAIDGGAEFGAEDGGDIFEPVVPGKIHVAGTVSFVDAQGPPDFVFEPLLNGRVAVKAFGLFRFWNGFVVFAECLRVHASDVGSEAHGGFGSLRRSAGRDGDGGHAGAVDEDFA